MKHSELVTTITKQLGKAPTQQEFADILGLTKNAISSRAFRDKEYTYNEVVTIENFYGINFEKQKDSNSLANDCENDNTISVDYYPEVFGSCGSGTFVPAEYKERINVPRKFFSAYSPSKQYSVINAFGDSMQPFINDRDKLLVEHWKGEQIKDNRVYVFRLNDKIFIKRLVDNVNQIVIKSDNNLYDPFKISYEQAAEEMQILGRIVGSFRDLD